MNILKKIVVWILCFCLILSIFASAAYTAFGADSEDFDDTEDYAYPTLDYSYYEFTNIVGIESSDDFIIVTELLTNTTGDYYNYVVFDEDGEFLHDINLGYFIGDPQKVEIFSNTAVSLNFLSDDTSMLYSTMLIDYASSYVGDYSAMLNAETAPIMRDFAITEEDLLYYIKIGTTDTIKSVKMSGGATVAQVVGAETAVDLDITGFTAIESCGDDILIETSYSNIYHYDTSSEVLTQITNMPSDEVLQFGGYDNHVFVLTSAGVYYCDIETSTDLELLLETTREASTDSNLVDPISFTVSYSGSLIKLLVADNEGAMAIKSFSLSNGSLFSNMSSIYSFSSSTDGYNTPTNVSASYQSVVVADSENNRVKVIDDDGDVSIYYTKDEDGDLITPIYAGIDYQENIYVISDDDELFVYTSSGNFKYMFDEFDDISFRNIAGLEVSPYDSTCYLYNKNSIIAFNNSTGELYCPVTGTSSADGIAIDYYNNYVAVYDSNSMDVYSLGSGELVYSLSRINYIGDVYDVEFDLAGNFYVLCSNGYYSVVSKYSMIDEDDDDYDEDEITYERVLASIFNSDSNADFVDMAINFEEEMAYFIKDGEHRLYYSEDLFDDLEVEYDLSTDIPSDIFEKTEQSDVQILNVANDGSRLLLPVSSKDDYYPTGYAIIRPIKLAENSKVIVAGTSDDGEISYVLYNNSVGFMYTSALEEITEDSELPFEDALVLHDNTYIYKYPLTTTSSMVPLYGFNQLEKDTALTILDLANDYVCPMGMLWYRVEADVDGESVIGYIPRYNVVENASETDNTYEYGRINANLFEGYATVYADEGITPLGTKIYDGEKVEIMAERGDYYYVREASPASDVAVEGYVLKELVTTDAQTRSFTIAVILIIVLVIAVAVIVFVKMKLRKPRIK